MQLSSNGTGMYHGFGLSQNGTPTQAQPQVQAPVTNRGMFSDPFSTAMSGTKSGTLQDYINRMTQQGSNALYGGLLGYSPTSMIAGDAGGTPIQSQVPQGFNIPSTLQAYMQQSGGGLNFGNRSWMNQGG